MKMIVAIQGTKAFDLYPVFLRAMGVALSNLPNEDKEFYIYSAGPAQINSMALEFSNISERSLRARGIKIKMIKVPPSWIKENVHSINYFAFFSKPKESVSDIVSYAESKDTKVGIYRY
jgi:hypothetical protein